MLETDTDSVRLRYMCVCVCLCCAPFTSAATRGYPGSGASCCSSRSLSSCSFGATHMPCLRRRHGSCMKGGWDFHVVWGGAGWVSPSIRMVLCVCVMCLCRIIWRSPASRSRPSCARSNGSNSNKRRASGFRTRQEARRIGPRVDSKWSLRGHEWCVWPRNRTLPTAGTSLWV